MTLTRILTLVVSLFLSTAAFAQFYALNALAISLGPIERIGDSDITNSFATIHNRTDLDIQNVTVRVNLINSGPQLTYVGGQNDERWTCRNDETPFRLVCKAPLIPAGQSVRLQIYVGPILPETRVTLSGYANWQYFEAQPYSNTAMQ